MAATDTSMELNQLAKAYGDAWNGQDLEGILAFHTDDCTFDLHTGTGPAVDPETLATIAPERVFKPNSS